MTRLLAALLLAVLFGTSLAHGQHRLNIINAESGLTKTELTKEVRRAIRTLRRQMRRVPFRITNFRAIEDPSNPDWPVLARAQFMWIMAPFRLGHHTIVFYNAGTKYPGYGIAQVCKRAGFAALSVPEKRSPLWIKFVLAHEIGHLLGARHDESGAEPLTLMHPYWDEFLDSPHVFEFSEYSLSEMRACGRFSGPAWEF